MDESEVYSELEFSQGAIAMRSGRPGREIADDYIDDFDES